ncbi:MAG: hypothetical protein HOP08_06220 [Cyclobacteriaceae bacterium]|nr:hypothetical protein [Cyclobacteriaceae bacterium]
MRPRPGEFGEPDKEWWASKLNPSDTSIAAVILFDYGKCMPESYGTKFIHKRRIKIYNKSALNKWANLSFILPGVRLADFECVVYNLENGQIIETEVDKGDLLKDDYTKNVKFSALAIPNVKEGSIFEYSYTLKTTSFEVPKWSFQHSIPVIWSEYEVNFWATNSGVFVLINGEYKIDLIESKNKRTRKYVLTDVPAFVSEPSMPSERYYKSSIEFRPDRFSRGITEHYSKDDLLKYGLIRDSVKMDTKIFADVKFRLKEDGEINGVIEIRKSGYEALQARKSLKKFSEEEFLKDQFYQKNWTVVKQELLNHLDSSKDLILKYELIIQDHVQKTDDFIYLNPYLVLQEESNPFKSETRIYPLDMGSRMARTVVTSIEIPEGYKIDELPKSMVIALPNKHATFYTQASIVGNSVYLTCTMKINKIIFNANEYPALREFFERIVAKKSELLVFKKK